MLRQSLGQEVAYADPAGRIYIILGSFASLFSRGLEACEDLVDRGNPFSRERTVTAALRVTGLSMEKAFANYHRVLNRRGGRAWKRAACCWDC